MTNKTMKEENRNIIRRYIEYVSPENEVLTSFSFAEKFFSRPDVLEKTLNRLHCELVLEFGKIPEGKFKVFDKEEVATVLVNSDGKEFIINWHE